MFAMKWYYKFKLNKIEAEIERLKKATESSLADNYTDHLRLRSLNRLAEFLMQRLAG
jgi:hypothetical protein